LTGLTFDVDGSGFWVAEVAPPGKIHHFRLADGVEDSCIQALSESDSPDRMVGDARIFHDIGIGDSLAAVSVPALGDHQSVAICVVAIALLAVVLARLRNRPGQS